MVIYPPVIKRDWLKIPDKWRFIAGKILEVDGVFSSKPEWITRGYWIPSHYNSNTYVPTVQALYCDPILSKSSEYFVANVEPLAMAKWVWLQSIDNRILP
jgi:hypothetical protein